MSHCSKLISHCVYSTEGRYIQIVGREGNKELEFHCPRGVGVSTVNNIIYICDLRNNRIQCLNLLDKLGGLVALATKDIF